MSTRSGVPNPATEPGSTGQLVRFLSGGKLSRRRIEETADVLGVRGVDGDAGGRGGARPAQILVTGGVRDEPLLNACRDGAGLVAVGAREHADELVSADACGAVLTAEDGTEHVGESLEHPVAGVVARAIVELARSASISAMIRASVPSRRDARASSLSITASRCGLVAIPVTASSKALAHLVFVAARPLDRSCSLVREGFDDRGVGLSPDVFADAPRSAGWRRWRAVDAQAARRWQIG